MNLEDHAISLTLATAEDLTALQGLYTDTIENICHRDYQPEQIEAWTAGVTNTERWLTAIRTQYFLVARAGTTIVGFGSLRDGDYIDFLYVHKDHQGRGIAGKIFAGLQRKSVELGKPGLTADVSRTARPFFEKSGFVVQRENQNVIRGVTVPNYRMKKVLSP